MHIKTKMFFCKYCKLKKKPNDDEEDGDDDETGRQAGELAQQLAFAALAEDRIQFPAPYVVVAHNHS